MGSIKLKVPGVDHKKLGLTFDRHTHSLTFPYLGIVQTIVLAAVHLFDITDARQLVFQYALQLCHIWALTAM